MKVYDADIPDAEILQLCGTLHQTTNKIAAYLDAHN